jgi:hypothetical protein
MLILGTAASLGLMCSASMAAAYLNIQSQDNCVTTVNWSTGPASPTSGMWATTVQPLILDIYGYEAQLDVGQFEAELEVFLPDVSDNSFAKYNIQGFAGPEDISAVHFVTYTSAFDQSTKTWSGSFSLRNPACDKRVPEGGAATGVLFGIALAGLGAANRHFKRR